jgi:probable phosphoglycerate mutase
MKIYLLRHGETSWNREHRLQGITDVPLNGVGVWQSRRLSRWFQKPNLAAIISSPLRRAQDTARILSGSTRCPIIIDERLREIDHGPWTGMRVGRMQRRFPVEFAAWRFLPETFRLAGSEGLNAVYSRSSGVLSNLIAANVTGDLLLVSHGVVNALLLCAALGAPSSRIWGYPQGNAQLSVLQVEGRQVVSMESQIDACS